VPQKRPNKPLTKSEAVRVLKAYSARNGMLDLLDPAFTVQNDFILDRSRLKVALCTRRAGKSMAAGLGLFKAALENPGCTCVYIALSRESAEKIMIKDVMMKINEKHNLGAKFISGQKIVIKLPNKSVIYFVGCDASPKELDKLRGQKYKLAIIDECASYTQDLRELVYAVLRPACMDEKGQIWMIGTPGSLISVSRKRVNSVYGNVGAAEHLDKPLFYSASEGFEGDWSIHRWNTTANPYQVDNYNELVADMKAANPNIVDTPFFKNEYLGQWFIDTDQLVFKYNPDINTVSELPPGSNYIYILGIDFGYTDASAFVVGAYSQYDNRLYIVHASKKEGMIVSDIEYKIRELMEIYPIAKFIVDGAAKQVVEELRQRTQLPFIPAEKQDKAGFIAILNNDLLLGQIKLLPETRDLKDELGAIIWGDREDRNEIHAGCPDHCADAFRYVWKHSYNYLATKERIPVKRGSEEEIEAFWAREEQKIEDEKNGRVKAVWEIDWNDTYGGDLDDN
jgi:hypothetical protein